MSESQEVEESSKDTTVEDGRVVEISESHCMNGADMVEEKREEETEEVEVEREEEEQGEEDEKEGEEDEEEEVEAEVDEEQDEVEEETETDEGEEEEQEPKDLSDHHRRELHEEVSVSEKPGKNMDTAVDVSENCNGVHVEKSRNDNHADVSEQEAGVSNGSTGAHQKPVVNGESESRGHDTREGNDPKLRSDAHGLNDRQSADDETTTKSHAEATSDTSSGLKVEVEHINDDDPKNDVKTIEAIKFEEGNAGPSCIFDTDTSGGGESGTEDEQVAFIHELGKFHKEKSLDFKPPKFYGEPLNLLKLWRSVMRLGGYDKVTACKYWRQVGESFKPPKTCTTVSWTFRIFYEKALLEYERYRTSGDGPSVPASLPVPMSVDNQFTQASVPGRTRRDAAARAMQGWHSQRILDNGEVSDPIIKDKNSMSLNKKEKHLKNLGMLKRSKPSSMDPHVKDVGIKVPKTQSDATVIDIGSPADWVKINVKVTKDCYEVYALVPGLLREEVRVQSDPAGRLVISGEPENPDNPWSVTPFKKVVNLPSRIDPHQTSAVVTLHGQLFVRVPFEHYD